MRVPGMFRVILPNARPETASNPGRRYPIGFLGEFSTTVILAPSGPLMASGGVGCARDGGAGAGADGCVSGLYWAYHCCHRRLTSGAVPDRPTQGDMPQFFLAEGCFSQGWMYVCHQQFCVVIIVLALSSQQPNSRRLICHIYADFCKRVIS